MDRCRSVTVVCAFAVVASLAAAPAWAQQGSVAGAVLDALGARVAAATVTLVGERQTGGETKSAADGTYTFESVAPGRYQVKAAAAGFESSTSEAVYVG